MRWTAVLCVLALSLTGCGGDDKSPAAGASKGSGAVSVTSTTTSASAAVILDATAAFDALRKLVGEPLQVRGVGVSNTAISLQVRERADGQPGHTPDNVDAYIFSVNKWTAPTPVKLNTAQIQALDGTFFDPAVVKWSALVDVGPKAVAKLEPELQNVRMGNFSITNDGQTASAILTGVRGSGHVRVNARTGEILEIARD
jgi:hypothetical protein